MFINDGTEDLHWVWLIVPNGLEDFFRLIGRPRSAGEPAPENFPRPENVLEIERWLKLGVVGRFNISETELTRRRLDARTEIEHLIALIESQPMGVQIGVIEENLPNTTFQLFRTKEKTSLGLSPFRLGGDLPNIRGGIAMLTSDAEPVRLYEELANDLWRRALKGGDASALLRTVLNRSAIAKPVPKKSSSKVA